MNRSPKKNQVFRLRIGDAGGFKGSCRPIQHVTRGRLQKCYPNQKRRTQAK